MKKSHGARFNYFSSKMIIDNTYITKHNNLYILPNI